ncbi:MAG: zinc-binding alcohol dehydrogenase family protein [Ignavibacteriota bacterium]
MRAMRAEGFGGYKDLKLVNIAEPAASGGRQLVKMTAAGVTPLDHTILTGGLPRAKAPLVLGTEGAGVVAEANASGLAAGTRVMFTGPYGVTEDGTYSEYLAVRTTDLSVIPDNIDDVSAAGLPVAYLTAHMALRLAGFQAGKTVLAPAIGGSVGNAVTQLARALGASHAMSTTTSHAKAERASELGFEEVIDLSTESLTEGVRRITKGYGADIVIDAVGGDILSEALGTLALGGSLTTLGYSGGRKSTIDVTDLIWKRASLKSFSLFAQPPELWSAAWKEIRELLESGTIVPMVAKVFALEDAAEALRFQAEERPFGRVVLKI